MAVNRRPGIRSLVLVVMIVVPSMAVASPGLAATKKKKANLHVSVPGNARVFQNYTIGAKGYSGRFNALSIYASKIKCPKNEALASSTFSHGYHYALTTKHNFKKSGTFVGSTTGKRTACVYLYDSSNPGGSQKHKFKDYTVSK